MKRIETAVGFVIVLFFSVGARAGSPVPMQLAGLRTVAADIDLVQLGFVPIASGKIESLAMELERRAATALKDAGLTQSDTAQVRLHVVVEGDGGAPAPSGSDLALLVSTSVEAPVVFDGEQVDATIWFQRTNVLVRRASVCDEIVSLTADQLEEFVAKVRQARHQAAPRPK